jgi:hypothetical protein
MTVTTPDGVSLRRMGTSGRGGDAESFIMIQFEPPSDEAEHLDIRFVSSGEDGGEPDIVARVRRMT